MRPWARRFGRWRDPPRSHPRAVAGPKPFVSLLYSKVLEDKLEDVILDIITVLVYRNFEQTSRIRPLAYWSLKLVLLNYKLNQAY